MKALVLAAVVAALLSVDAFGQSYDSTADGIRTIASKSEWVRSGMADKHPLQLSVVAVQNPDSGQWHHSLSVGVSSMISEAIPEGAILLIRTRSGDVIELKNSLDALTSQDFKGTIVAGTTIVTYTNQAMYDISEEDLRKLSGGVQKVRVQLAGETFDTEYRKDRWAPVLGPMLAELQALKNKSSDVREGF